MVFLFLLSTAIITTAIISDAIITDGLYTRKFISCIKDKFNRNTQIILNTTIIEMSNTQKTPTNDTNNVQEKTTEDEGIALDFACPEKFLFSVLYVTILKTGEEHQSIIMEKWSPDIVESFQSKIMENLLNKNLSIDGNRVYVYRVKFGTVILPLGGLVLDSTIIRADDSVWKPTQYEMYKEGLERTPPLIELDEQDSLPLFSTDKWVYTSVIGGWNQKIKDIVNYLEEDHE